MVENNKAVTGTGLLAVINNFNIKYLTLRPRKIAKD